MEELQLSLGLLNKARNKAIANNVCEELAPICYICTACGKDSSYRVEHNNKLPINWKLIEERGVFCASCFKREKKKK